jgi:hypothetical protein
MIEPKIIADFPKCMDCGCEVTISRLGTAELRESGKLAEDAFTMLEQSIIPLEQPALAAVTVRCIQTFYDVCAECGRRRCTRAQVIQAPVQVQPNQANQMMRHRGDGGNYPFAR